MKYEIYKSLSIEEQEEVRKGYVSTKKGEEVMKKFNRLYIYSVVYLLIAIVLLVGFFLDWFKWYYLIFAGVLVIVGVYFVFAVRRLKLEQYCKYIQICNKVNEIKNQKKRK